MRTISLACVTGKRRVRAIVFGAWAVHRAVPVQHEGLAPDGTWAISHVPTGMSLASLVHGLDIDDATTIAEALDDSGEGTSKELDAHPVMAVVGAALAGHYRRAARP